MMENKYLPIGRIHGYHHHVIIKKKLIGKTNYKSRILIIGYTLFSNKLYVNHIQGNNRKGTENDNVVEQKRIKNFNSSAQNEYIRA